MWDVCLYFLIRQNSLTAVVLCRRCTRIHESYRLFSSLSHQDKCWKVNTVVQPSESCSVSSAGLCLLCWLSSGCRDTLVPLERLQTLLMLEETRLWDVRHSLSSIWCLGTKSTRVCSLRQHFCCSAFCFFLTSFLFWLLPAAQRNGSHHTRQTGETFFCDWPWILQPTVYHNFACGSHKSTFRKAVLLTQCVVFPEFTGLHVDIAMTGTLVRTVRQRWQKNIFKILHLTAWSPHHGEYFCACDISGCC